MGINGEMGAVRDSSEIGEAVYTLAIGFSWRIAVKSIQRWTSKLLVVSPYAAPQESRMALFVLNLR